MSNLVFYGLAALAVICYGILPVIAKKMEITIPPLAFIAITMFLLSAIALGASFLFERSFRVENIRFIDWMWLLAFSSINFIGFVFLLKSITTVPVAHYQLMAGAIVPIVGGVLAYLLFAQQLGFRFFLALPIIFFGLYIAFVR